MRRCLAVFTFSAAAWAGSVAPRNIDELKTAIQNALVRYSVPGAGIAIVTADRVVWAGGVGKADLATGRDVTADTCFRLGSISKSFVALAIVKLAEEGVFDLEEPIENVIPEIPIPNPWKAIHPVRIAHVLEHTAGFDEARFAEDYYPPGAPELTLAEVLRRFPGPQRVRWQPGTRFAYSNAGYVVAGYLIEKATGRRYDEYIREEILKPLGMARSGFRPSDIDRGLLAQGYNYRPPRAVPYRATMLGPAGELMSSPAEFVPFLQKLLRREIGSLDRIERGRTSVAAEAGLATYGLGNYSWLGGYRRHGHSGLIEGFRSSYFYLPDAGVAYVVMTNSSGLGGGSAELYRIVHEFATAAIPKRTPPPAVSYELPAKWLSGVYVPRDYRSQIAAFSEAFVRARRVRVVDGAVYVSGLLGEGKRKLVPLAGGTFRAENDVEPTVAFVQIGDRRIMTGCAGYFERVPGWQPYWYAGTVVAALLVMASSILYAFAWIRRRRTAARAVPTAAVLCLATAGLLAAAFVEDMSVLGRVNFRTAGYVIFTWLFVGFAGAGVAVSLRPVKVYPLLVSLACCAVAAAMADWGLLGVHLWRY